MTWEIFAQYLLTGIVSGFIYALVAIGFNIIYSTTGIINFAQGEFVMLGAMIAISLHALLPGALPLCVVLAVVLTMLFGAALDFCFIRPARRAGILRLIVITIGLSIVIREAAFHLWGDRVRKLAPFSGSEDDSLLLLGARVTPQKLWVVALCSLAVLALNLFFRRTLLGKAMRACAANRPAARLCGINTSNLTTVAFMLSAGLGALAGCVLSPITFTTYDVGTGLAIKGFTVAILGGLGNSLAAVAAGIIVGVIESLSTHVLPLVYKDVVTLSILLLILFFRPHGLFGGRLSAASEEQ